jgi:hypothetical protein
MPSEELHNSPLGLQLGHIDVEVDPVDPLDRKLHIHMMAEDLGHALCYHACGFGRTDGFVSRRPLDRSSVLPEPGSTRASS